MYLLRGFFLPRSIYLRKGKVSSCWSPWVVRCPLSLVPVGFNHDFAFVPVLFFIFIFFWGVGVGGGICAVSCLGKFLNFTDISFHHINVVSKPLGTDKLTPYIRWCAVVPKQFSCYSPIGNVLKQLCCHIIMRERSSKVIQHRCFRWAFDKRFYVLNKVLRCMLLASPSTYPYVRQHYIKKMKLWKTSYCCKVLAQLCF